MATLAAQQLKILQNKVLKAIDNFEGSEFFEKIPGVIRERTRQGFGVSDGGALVILPGLKPSTIDRRITLDRNGKLSPKTAPFFSNLTESGKMLDSLRFKKYGKTYSIGFDERRTRNGKTPSQIKDFVEALGFKFFALANVERDLLEQRLARKLEKEIAKIFR